MITEHDLREAIAECEGVREPTSTTCIKLAAYYTLLDHLFSTNEPETPVVRPSYSYAEPPETPTTYQSETEFGEAIRGADTADVMAVIDEAMSLLKPMNSRLYGAIIERIKEKGR